MRDGFGIVQLSGKPGASAVRSTGKSWKPGGGRVFVLLLVSREGEGEIHMV